MTEEAVQAQPETAGDVGQIAVTVDDIAVLLRRLLARPQGKLQFVRPLVGAGLPILRVDFAPPCWSVTVITTAGDPNLEVSLNEIMPVPVLVFANEVLELDVAGPQIERVFLRAAAGTLTPRLIGLY